MPEFHMCEASLNFYIDYVSITSPNSPFVSFTTAQDEAKAQLLRMVYPERDFEAELDAETPLRAPGCGCRLDGARLERTELEREETGTGEQSTGKSQCNTQHTLIIVYKGSWILKTRGIPYFF